VLRNVPAGGAARVTVEIDGASAVGSCHDPAGLPLGATVRADLAADRCVPVAG
jgi:hypothetical protein